jgi:hypothetical protein
MKSHMNVATLAKGFPNGITVPAELQALCTFADRNEGRVSGLFEFDSDGRASALAWFDGDTAAADQFAVFGCGPDGSLYAFWLHAGPDAAKAPIVLLDSECEGSGVIAADMREFLRLLAIGYDEPGRYPTLQPDNLDNAKEFQEWLKSEFYLVPPATAEAIVDSARNEHPDLMAWIHEWQARHS